MGGLFIWTYGSNKKLSKLLLFFYLFLSTPLVRSSVSTILAAQYKSVEKKKMFSLILQGSFLKASFQFEGGHLSLSLFQVHEK